MRSLIAALLLLATPACAQTITGGGGSPGGSTTQLQYNNANAFGGLNAYVDNANQLSTRNGATAQTLRVYNTYTDASNGEWAAMDWQSLANTLTIGTNNNGTGAGRLLRFVVGGNTVMDYGITQGSVWTVQYFGVANALLTNELRSYNGNSVLVRNYNATGLTSLQLGGTTSSFPELKVSGTTLVVRLADDTADAPLLASTLQTDVKTVATLPTCNAAAKGTRSAVSDATSPTFLGTLTGGSTVNTPVFCNGTAWVAG